MQWGMAFDELEHDLTFTHYPLLTTKKCSLYGDTERANYNF